MADFKYEVLATYAEKDNLKVRSVSFNDRDPKFDVRHWNGKDGKESMGKGVTLTIEELKWLATELPKVYATLTGGKAKAVKEEPGEESEPEATLLTDDDDNEPEQTTTGLDEKSTKFVNYIIKNAPDSFKGVNVIDGVTYATESHIICALKGSSSEIQTTDVDIKKFYDKAIPAESDLKEVKSSLVKKIKDDTVKMLKKGTLYSLGENYSMVNAEYAGKAIRAVGENAKLYVNSNGRMYVAKGDNGTVVILAVNGKRKEVGLVKVA